MVRKVLSYLLTSLILVSQVGLPLHFHYCKGMLESVTMLFNPGCDDHQEITDLPACCQKAETKHCTKDNDKCCDDKVVVLTQEITSVAPHLLKWTDISFVAVPMPVQDDISLTPVRIVHAVTNAIDTGPPIYILHQSLIFYA